MGYGMDFTNVTFILLFVQGLYVLKLNYNLFCLLSHKFDIIAKMGAYLSQN